MDTDGAVDKVENTLTKKAGPLPVWAWGLVVGGVLVGFMWWQGRASGAAPTASDPTGGANLDADGINNAGLFSGNDANAANASLATASTSGVVKSNAAWLRMGVQYETGKHVNALVATRSLTKFLAGATLTAHQGAIVSDVITHVGLPPKPPKKISPVKPPKHPGGSGGNGGSGETPPTKPPIKQAVVSQHLPETRIVPRVGMVSVAPHIAVSAVAGDSPASIAHQVYGNSTPTRVAGISSMNPVGLNQQFVPGQTVKVPTNV